MYKHLLIGIVSVTVIFVFLLYGIPWLINGPVPILGFAVLILAPVLVFYFIYKKFFQDKDDET